MNRKQRRALKKFIGNAYKDVPTFLRKEDGSEVTKEEAEQFAKDAINILWVLNDPNGVPCLSPAENVLQEHLCQKMTDALNNGDPNPLSEEEEFWLAESFGRVTEYVDSHIHKDLKGIID